jgi:hypothetical protein
VIVSRSLATVCLLFAWLCANGAILDVVQVFAWTKMFTGYAQEMPVAHALKETFDPAKPCELCVGVAKAKDQAEKELPPAAQHDAAKFLLAIHAAETPVFANDHGEWMTGLEPVACKRTDPVPLPPPRV